MRKWLLAILPLIWSCADNLPDPATVTPELQSLDFPTTLVADWPEPLAFRVKAALPANGDWTVMLRVTGPGAAGAVRDYLLLDDGDDRTLSAPGPGQETHSGDNVAGDGWFTALIAPDFAAGAGAYTLRARLLDGGVEEDFRQVTRDCVDNRAPEILAFAAPDTLPSGGSFTLTLRAADPDGQEDIAGVVLTQPGGVLRSWPFVPTADDSVWTVTVGPELAARHRGLDSLTIELSDRVGHVAHQSLVVELENSAPSLRGDELQFYQQLTDGSFVPLDTGDTIHLYVPSTSPSDSNNYVMTIPVFDPQTLADITDVTWEITAVDNPAQTLTASMEDPNGIGLFQAGIKLNGRPVPYQWTVYYLRFLAYDPFNVSTVEQRFIRIHNVGDPAASGGGRLSSSDSSRFVRAPAPTGPINSAGAFR